MPCLRDSITMNPDLIRACVPHLYEVVPRRRDKQRSSYAMKHDVEYLLDEYVSNTELKEALMRSIPHTWGEPNFSFHVKPKFDLFWLRSPPTVRPKGARKSHWEAYQSALAWVKSLQGEAGSQQTPLSSPVHSLPQDEQHPCNP
jgi:hypothetical protein